MSFIKTDNWEVTPPCKYFALCGGCSLQHLAKPEEYKFSLVTEAIKKISFNGILHPLKQISINTRRRVQFKVSNKRISFSKWHSNEAVHIEKCLLLDDKINNLIKPLNQLLSKLKSKIDKISITNSDTNIELVFHSNIISSLTSEEILTDFAIHNNIGRIAWQPTKQSPYAIVELKPIQLEYQNILIDLPINSFLQVSKESNTIMTNIILNHLINEKDVLELYAGCGSFTVPIALKHKVFAIEGSQEAIVALKNTANKYQLPIKTIKQDLYYNPVTTSVIDKYEQIVINPPRNGASPQIAEIAKSLNIKKVILVSCSLDNFIRDSKILLNSGFELTEIHPIDQFLYSKHLEIIGCYTKL